jgi:hypothetical protein
MSPKLPEPTTGTVGPAFQQIHCSDGRWLWHGAFSAKQAHWECSKYSAFVINGWQQSIQHSHIAAPV